MPSSRPGRDDNVIIHTTNSIDYIKDEIGSVMLRDTGQGAELLAATVGEPGLGGYYSHAEREAVMNVFRDMESWGSSYSRQRQEAFEEAFAAHSGAAHAVAVNSGGVALDMAMRALDATPGDEVISCAINFPGCHLAVLGAGLRLVLAEPDPFTLNLDPGEIARRMTPRTTAVLVTHMNGLAAEMSAIGAAVAETAVSLGIPPPRVIVDAARAVGAATPEGPVGSQGWVTVFSFHRKKAMTTLGEGGIITTDCPATAHRLRQIRSFGDRECWGSSYRMTEFQAAVGLVQLTRLRSMNDARIRLARQRSEMLRELADRQTLSLPPEPPGYRHVYYLYNLILGSAESPEIAVQARDQIRGLLLRCHAVGTVIANPPTYHVHKHLATRVADQGPFPVAEAVAGRLLCLPMHPLMSEEDNARIAEAVVECVSVACRP